jgi:hypothetical protein
MLKSTRHLQAELQVIGIEFFIIDANVSRKIWRVVQGNVSRTVPSTTQSKSAAFTPIPRSAAAADRITDNANRTTPAVRTSSITPTPRKRQTRKTARTSTLSLSFSTVPGGRNLSSVADKVQRIDGNATSGGSFLISQLSAVTTANDLDDQTGNKITATADSRSPVTSSPLERSTEKAIQSAGYSVSVLSSAAAAAAGVAAVDSTVDAVMVSMTSVVDDDVTMPSAAALDGVVSSHADQKSTAYEALGGSSHVTLSLETETGVRSSASIGSSVLEAKDTVTSSAVKDTVTSSAVKDTGTSSAVKDTVTSSAVKDTGTSSAVKDTGTSSAVKDTGTSSAEKDTGTSSAVKEAGTELASPVTSGVNTNWFDENYSNYTVHSMATEATSDDQQRTHMRSSGAESSSNSQFDYTTKDPSESASSDPATATSGRAGAESSGTTKRDFEPGSSESVSVAVTSDAGSSATFGAVHSTVAADDSNGRLRSTADGGKIHQLVSLAAQTTYRSVTSDASDAAAAVANTNGEQTAAISGRHLPMSSANVGRVTHTDFKSTTAHTGDKQAVNAGKVFARSTDFIVIVAIAAAITVGVLTAVIVHVKRRGCCVSHCRRTTGHLDFPYSEKSSRMTPTRRAGVGGKYDTTGWQYFGIVENSAGKLNGSRNQ